jgi:hypothetical protein
MRSNYLQNCIQYFSSLGVIVAEKEATDERADRSTDGRTDKRTVDTIISVMCSNKNDIDVDDINY